jgi:hypothetical protein
MATYQHLSQPPRFAKEASHEGSQQFEDQASSESSYSKDDDGSEEFQAENDKETLRHTTPGGSGRAWETGVLKRFPWRAGAACLLALVCTTACVVILVKANNRPTLQWKISPSILLAILVALINASLSYVLTKAVNYR